MGEQTHVQVHVGPRRSGRAAAIDAAFAAAHPHALLLTPTRQYARTRAAEMVSAGHVPGLLGRPIESLTAFAQRLVEAEVGPAQRLDDWERLLLLRRCLHDWADQHPESPYAGAARRDGVAEHVARFITQLKQAAIEPEEFTVKLHASRDAAPADDMVEAVYEDYQWRLRESSQFDVPGLFWRAYDLAQAARPHVLDGVVHVLLDGFDDFTPSELRLVVALAAHTPITIGLNLDPDPDRQDLFLVPHRTYAAIREAMRAQGHSIGVSHTHGSIPPESCAQFAAAHLAWRDLPQGPDALRDDLAVAPVSDAAHEAESVGRAVKSLLLEGVPPDAVAVVAPNAEAARQQLTPVFQEFGVPLQRPGQRPLGDSRLGRSLLRLFTAWQGYSREAVLEVLCDPWCNAPESAGYFPLLARGLGVVAGEADWRRAAECPAAALDAFHDLAPDAETLADAHAALARAFARLSAAHVLVNGVRDAAALVTAINEACERVGLTRAAAGEEDAAEAWHAWQRALDALARYAPALDDGECALRLLREAVSRTQYAAEARSGVHLHDLATARNLTYRHVFALGLNEGVLPAPPATDSLYNEVDRAALRDQGIALETAEERIAQEQLRFHHLLGLATERLTLHYRLLSGSGREALPSPFVADVVQLLGDGYRIAAPAPLADAFVPWPGSAASLRDVRNALFLRAPSQAEAWSEFAATRAGVLAETCRYDSAPYGPYDGVLEAPPVAALVSERHGDAHLWSAHQLEMYLDCPFQFFAQRLCRISDIPAPAYGFDALLRGDLIHRALQLLATQDGLRTPGTAQPSDVRAALDSAYASRRKALLRYAPRVAAIERDRLERQLLRYCAREPELEFAGTPVALEARFGRPGDGAAADDACVVVETPAGAVRLTGRIDRVDRTAQGLCVIDYKSGEVPQPKELTAGFALQVMVYAWACEVLWPDTPCAAGYYVPVTRPAKVPRDALGKRLRTPEWNERNEAARKCIADAVQGVRAGWFPPQRRGKTCYGCGTAHACRHETGRIRRKGSAGEWDDADED